MPTVSPSLCSPNRSRPSAWWTALGLGLLLSMIAIIVLADLGDDNALFSAVRRAPMGDKVSHFTLFGAFAYVANRALGYPIWRFGRWRVPAASVLILLAASAEELSQYYFPHRTLDLVDWFADVAGIVCFTWLAKPRAASQRSAD